jgi:hypothetical protein
VFVIPANRRAVVALAGAVFAACGWGFAVLAARRGV